MKIDISKKVNHIIDLIDNLKTIYSFKDQDNQEDYLDTMEYAVTSLQDLQDIIDRDAEYAYYKEQVIKDENSNN